MGEHVSFASNGGSAEGYLARAAEPGPAVLVIQEYWGLVPHITEVADRFAAAGFTALAPDLYHGVQATEPDEAMKMLMGLAMDVAARDIAGAAAHLRSLGATKVGAVGFCMGGSLALFAPTVGDVDAAVGFYPAVPWERMSPTWERYSGRRAQIHCSEGDGTSAAPGIQQARSAIEAAGGSVTLFDYPGTEHAFFNDTRPEVYQAAAAGQAWERTLSFLRESLV